MRHNQVSVLEIVQQVTRELDIDQVDVVDTIFNKENAIQMRWLGLLKKATEWLLTLQINGASFLPLLKDTSLSKGYSRLTNTSYIRVSYVNGRNCIRYYVNNQGRFYRTSLFGINAFSLPNDMWLINSISPNKAYKVRGNELYMKNVDNISINYISCFAFKGSDFRTYREPLKDSDICLLDKELMVLAIKYMNSKEISDPSISFVQEEVMSRANFMLGEDMESNYGNNKISFGRF